MSLKINGQVIENTFDSTMKADVRKSTSIAPTSVSPVLKTKITIKLESEFPHTLKREDFTVNATSTTKEGYVRYMNVIAVDDEKKELTVMFGGAWSGEFKVNVRHKDYGLVDTSAVTLDVSASVDSFSPVKGSIYGGQLLTITGKNFGTEKTDNPVQISYNGGVGSTDCFV